MTRGAVKPGMTNSYDWSHGVKPSDWTEIWGPNGCFNVNHPNGDLPNIAMQS